MTPGAKEVLELARRARADDDDALMRLIERTEPRSIETLVCIVFPDHHRSSVTTRQFDRLCGHLDLWRDLHEYERLSVAS